MADLSALGIGWGASQGLEQLLARRLAEAELQQRRELAEHELAMRQQSLQQQAEMERAQMESMNAWRGFQAENAMADNELASQVAMERQGKNIAESTPRGTKFRAKTDADVLGRIKAFNPALVRDVSDPMAEGPGIEPTYEFAGLPEKETAPKGRYITVPGSGGPVNRWVPQEEEAQEYVAPKSTSGGGSSLTPAGLDVAATQYATTGQMPPLGMGNAQMRAAIINRAAEMFPGLNVGKEAAGYRAESGSLLQMTKRYNAVEAYANQAAQSLENARRLAPSVSNSGSPMVNRYRNWVNKNLKGSAPLSQFEVFVYTAARDYARVTTGGSESVAQMTDAATEAADALLNTAQTPEAFMATLSAMKADMDNVKSSYRAQMEQLMGSVGNTPGSERQANTPAPTDVVWERDPKTGKLVKKGQ